MKNSPEIVPYNSVNLRGHHIRSLANFYFKGYLKGRRSKMIMGYSDQHNQFVKELFESIIIGESGVRIVKRLDDICNFPCPNMTRSCSGIVYYREDMSTLGEYGLIIRPEIYSPEDIMNRIIEYKKRTGQDSPEKKFMEIRISGEIEE